MEYQIGQFSKITKITIKALHYYHEYGILVPVRIDQFSGYRYYSEDQLEKARIIKELKTLDFSLKDIKDILENYSEDADIFKNISDKYVQISNKIVKLKEIQNNLEIILLQMEEEKMSVNDNQIIIKNLPDMIIASIRFKGKYEEVGKAYSELFKKSGRYIAGKPFLLHYDEEYKEENADIEACIPIKKEINADKINCRVLKGGQALTLIHKGPYPTIGKSYKILIDYINKNNLTIQTPTRDIYLKGPGMIFKGNPHKYITEIQVFTE